jgi:hypothetical protein
MQIEQAAISLNSKRTAAQKHTVKESLKTWVGDRSSATERTSSQSSARLSQEAVEINLSHQGRTVAKMEDSQKTDNPDDAISDIRLRTIKLLFEKIYDLKFDIFSDEEPNCSTDENSSPAANDRAGWGAEYDYQESYYEAENTNVSASGLIKTADGQEIQFTLNLTMSREFMTEKEEHLRLGDAAKDPLVINFDGTAAQLASTKFLFDLDIDGQAEEISFAAPSSGFLALDLNSDGRINNGSELFGPTTGNGFSELAAYDEDGNQWLDQKDSVFARLRVWTKDGQDLDHLTSLADKGIGAIYLEPIHSEFSVKDSQNKLLGQVRSSSLYVQENGSVGTVQQLDLAI